MSARHIQLAILAALIAGTACTHSNLKANVQNENNASSPQYEIQATDSFHLKGAATKGHMDFLAVLWTRAGNNTIVDVANGDNSILEMIGSNNLILETGVFNQEFVDKMNLAKTKLWDSGEDADLLKTYGGGTYILISNRNDSRITYDSKQVDTIVYKDADGNLQRYTLKDNLGSQ